jgi:large subunit ribosomal protein L3
MLTKMIGKKIGMTQVFDEEGRIVPVTVIAVGPATVTQVIRKEKHGYSAVQVGFIEKRAKNTTKPVLGHFAKANCKPFRFFKEMRMETDPAYEVGQAIGPEVFEGMTWVDVVGVSKGKGFQGIVKRYHAGGGKNTHGSMHHRQPGSIGASSFPSRVIKGLQMAGHMGQQRTTLMKLKVIKIDKEKNLLLLRGSVPGANNDLVMIRKSNRGGQA